MLKLLQPNKEPTHEIDYLLVIKMLKYDYRSSRKSTRLSLYWLQVSGSSRENGICGKYAEFWDLHG